MMALVDLQSALGSLVVARASALDRGLDLTTQERAWLQQLTGSAGFGVTCYIQRWWRETRLHLAARLTLAVLGPERGAELLAAYLDRVPVSSLFFIPEAVGFLDFVLGQGLEIPHLEAVARFERAVLLAAQAVSLPPAPSNAVVVEFAAPPDQVLWALVRGEPLPSPGEHVFGVLVAPWLPGLWRLAAE
jgi:hypothetical protein